MNNNTHQSIQDRYDDEISLYDLYRVLVERKLIIFATVSICLLLAVLYLVITPPTYEAKVRILPPKPNMLVLSRPEHELTKVAPDVVFNELELVIQLKETWQHFLAAKPKLFTEGDIKDHIQRVEANPVKLSKDKNFSTPHFELTYQSSDAQLTARILEDYLEFVRYRYVSDFVADIRQKIALRKEALEQDIATMRKRAKLAREDAIEQLSKDLEQAKTLGITDNLLMRMTDVKGSGQSVNIISDSQIVRNYMRGSRALQTELDVLLKRESDDPYIDGLREKQLELETLNNLQISIDKINPYLQDGETLIPQHSIKPRKALVLVLSVVIGGFLGVLLAFLVNGIQNARRPEMK